MTELAERFRQRYFRDAKHPYRVMEQVVESRLRRHHTILDAGCGRTAPILARYRGMASRLVGIDVIEFSRDIPGLELYQRDLASTGLEECSIDIVMARSVLEHVADPDGVYREIFRILRPGGYFIFLTANLWDYASIIAKIIPNRFHPWIVARTEGREEEDVFPVEYRTNTKKQVFQLSSRHGFEVESFEYLGQYPSYFMFNGVLFLAATGYEKIVSRFESLAWLRGWILAVLHKCESLGA